MVVVAESSSLSVGIRCLCVVLVVSCCWYVALVVGNWQFDVVANVLC